MNIIGNQDDEIDNEISFNGQKLVDTEAKGKPANIMANWIGAGLFFFIVALALTVTAVMRKSA